ncbi:IgGFc-binding protein-like [Babylonia areolata]|uniref:IgGFc-binding protein-like n=1 Tax=Babylonia areolata TaxID=304850 RepID=UPI003FD479AF
MRTLTLFLWSLLCVGRTRGDPGKWYLVTFPQALFSQNPKGYVRMTAVGAGTGVGGAVSVSLTTLPSAPAPLTLSLSLQPGQVETFEVDQPAQVLPAGTLISNMTVEIVASDLITVEVVNSISSNGDIFSPIPVDKLGTEYFAAAWARQHVITASFVTVSAAYHGTVISLTFPPGQREQSASSSSEDRFVLQGVTYFPNDVMTFTLDRLQTMQLQSSRDLTGSRITSSHPVAVLSGLNRTSLSGAGCLSHLLEQMPPTTNWATTFVLIHLPEQTAGDTYRFVAKDPMTTLTLAGGAQTLRIQEAGGFVEYDLPHEELVLAVADKPVLAVQYTRDQPAVVSGAKDHGDPAMLVLTPWEQAGDVYHILTPSGGVAMYVVITVRAQETGSVKLNGEALQSPARNVTWSPVIGSADLVVGHVRLAPEDVPCTLGESGGPRMNAHVYYAQICECWAMSLTHGEPLSQNLGQQTSCPLTPHTPGDGVDNDCDQATDEEPCYVNTQPQDTDGDQYKNEDCARQDTPKCLGPSGVAYPCEELWRSSEFTVEPEARRHADTMTLAARARSKTTCAMTCASTAGCWGTNFDPQGREGHLCELLFGWGRGLVAAPGWGFQSLKSSHSVFSNP